MGALWRVAEAVSNLNAKVESLYSDTREQAFEKQLKGTKGDARRDVFKEIGFRTSEQWALDFLWRLFEEASCADDRSHAICAVCYMHLDKMVPQKRQFLRRAAASGKLGAGDQDLIKWAFRGLEEGKTIGEIAARDYKGPML